MKNNLDILVIQEKIESIEEIVDLLDTTEFKTKVASNGISAIQALEQDLPDVIICDLMLSDLNYFLFFLKHIFLDQKISLVFIASEEKQTELEQNFSHYASNVSLNELLFKAISIFRDRDRSKNNDFIYLNRLIKEAVFNPLHREKELNKALQNEEFEIYYQPKVNLRNGHIVGCEALLRWNHPVKGLILPSEFIPLAETTGAIVDIGEYVLDRACQQVKSWQKEGFWDLSLAINISARQLIQADFDRRLIAILTNNNFDPRYLELELTETILLSSFKQVAEHLNSLQCFGIRISIDDFGTGYSSLSYLQQLPINCLKIPIHFIEDITKNINNQTIVKAIIQIARSMNLDVVAEGVETIDALEFCDREGCDYVQGYIFSEPLPAEDFLKLLKTSKYLQKIDKQYPQ